jgi:hypothetical protein
MTDIEIMEAALKALKGAEHPWRGCAKWQLTGSPDDQLDKGPGRSPYYFGTSKKCTCGIDEAIKGLEHRLNATNP